MDWFTYSQILMDKCKEKEIPFHAGFELTPYCNFNCNMCYIHLSPEEVQKKGRLLSTEQWIHLAEEARKLGTMTMEITGGEALTRKDFPVLYSRFVKMGYLIVLRTNGYLLKGDLLELIKNEKPRVVMITLYGASNETYRKVCGIDDGFSVVTENIIALRDAGVSVRLTSTITNDNFTDVQAMQDWASENGFQLSLGGYLFTPVRGSKKSIRHLQIRYPDKDYEIPEEMQPIHREIPDREKYMNPFWMCRTFGAKFSITWDGKMVVCYSNPSVWKDPITTSVEDAFHELYRELKTVRRPEKCERCQYIDFCSICPSMLFSSTGSMEQTNDDMCKYAYRNYKNKMLRMPQNQSVDVQIPDEQFEEGEMTANES